MVGKTELAQKVAQRLNMSNSKGAQSLDAVLSAIEDALKGGDEVRITGFGSFRVNETKARQGRNPRTGQTINIPASKRVAFSPGSRLSAGVKG